MTFRGGGLEVGGGSCFLTPSRIIRGFLPSHQHKSLICSGGFGQVTNSSPASEGHPAPACSFHPQYLGRVISPNRRKKGNDRVSSAHWGPPHLSTPSGAQHCLALRIQGKRHLLSHKLIILASQASLIIISRCSPEHEKNFQTP